MNPIFEALSNHKYDTSNYDLIAPEYGTIDDLITLTEDLKSRGMHLVLDGVFNHVGKHHPWFQDALTDSESKYRNWFNFADSRVPPRASLAFRTQLSSSCSLRDKACLAGTLTGNSSHFCKS